MLLTSIIERAHSSPTHFTDITRDEFVSLRLDDFQHSESGYNAAGQPCGNAECGEAVRLWYGVAPLDGDGTAYWAFLGTLDSLRAVWDLMAAFSQPDIDIDRIPEILQRFNQSQDA